MADEEQGAVAPEPEGRPVWSGDEELLPLTASELRAIEAGEPLPSPDASELIASDASLSAGVSNIRSFKKVFWYQLLSGTLYGVYWFFRNYKQFAIHKKLDVKPAPMALALVTTWAIISTPHYFETSIWVDLGCFLTATWIYGWFFYRQFLRIAGFVAGLGYKYPYSPGSLAAVLGVAFLCPSLLTLVVKSDTPVQFVGVFLVVSLICAAISGRVLSEVQEVLNFIWASHQKRSYNTRIVTPVSAGEKIFIGVLCVFGVLAVLAYFSGVVILFGDASPSIEPTP